MLEIVYYWKLEFVKEIICKIAKQLVSNVLVIWCVIEFKLRSGTKKPYSEFSQRYNVS